MGMAVGPGAGRGWGLDGLQWMNVGDRALVRALRAQPVGTVLVEAVGDPYSEHGRLSSASGVPAVLGWANHENVWRGRDILPETERRAELVRQVYASGDPESRRYRHAPSLVPAPRRVCGTDPLGAADL